MKINILEMGLYHNGKELKKSLTLNSDQPKVRDFLNTMSEWN